MAGLESFTIEAILSATDKATDILERVQAAFNKLKETMGSAAETAAAAGEEIDSSLLQTASGADALSLANDRLSASQAKVALATQEQAVAERELQDTYSKGLGLEEQAAAGDKLAAAIRDVAKASGEAEVAQQTLNDMQKALGITSGELAVSEDAAAASTTGWVGVVALAAAAIAGVGGLAVNAAADFQTATTHLVTDAGESSDKIQGVSQSMLNMAGDVGISADKLAQGMYHIESAGFHAGQGVDMLRVAAQGAKVGGADLDTVSKTLAGTMISFADKGYTATQMMNMLIETTAQGDLRMQDLSSTLGNVTPIAAAAGVTFDQVGGAIATMTSQNMSAAQATQNLAHFIQSLERPNNVQINQMQELGLNANDVSATLAGPNGLVNTVNLLTTAIGNHTKNGQVFIDTLQGSETAAQDANRMLGLMSPTVRDLSERLADGKISVKDYTTAIHDMDPISAKQGTQFLGLQEKMGAFNKLLANGSPEAETFNSAMANLTGGQIGLRTALMLSADGGRKFSDASKAIADTGKEAGDKVKNWDTIQKTFNQKIDQAKASFDAFGITIGQKIMPYVEKIVGIFMAAFDWFSKNKLAVDALATALGVFLGAALIIIGVLVGGVIAILTILGLIFMGIAEAAMYVWDALKTAWGGVVEATEWLWDKLKGAFKAVVDAVVGAWDWIVDVTTSVWDGIKAFFEKWWPLLYAIFATPIFLIQSLWHHFHDDIMSVVTPAWNWIKGVMSGAWDWLAGAAQSSWNWIKHWIISPVEDAINWLDGGMKWLNDTVMGAFNGLVRWFDGVGDWFNKVGTGIIDGIWHGIKSGWGWLTGKVGDLANSLLDAAKNAIGVKSPSRRFADEFGKWIPHGIAAGISEHGDVARGAVSALADSLHFNGTDLGLGGVGGGGAGQVVIFDLRGSQVTSDRDMDLLVDKIGRQIATRLLPAGGVRIRA